LKDYFPSFNIGGIYHFIHLLDVSLHEKDEKKAYEWKKKESF
jgi:hypothetical protein